MTQGICIEQIFSVGSRTFTHREYPQVLAMVRSIRRNIPSERVSFVGLRRDQSGRFAKRALA